MRKFLFLFYTLFISATLFAQLEVKPGSFKEVAGFVNINLDKQTDDNDRPYAVVKVKTENISDKQRRELLFEGDGRTFIECEYKVGEVWLYISYYASYIKISHPDFSSTEIVLPFDMQPKKGYEMILVNKYNKDDKKDVYNYLIVKADQPNAVIYIDNEYVGEQEVYKSYKAGEKHNWRIECDLFYNETGEAVIPDKEGENMTIEKVLRPAFGYINVTSSPENGAVVFIDGKKVGQTPYKSERLTSGDHTVKVMKEMFFPAENIITVTDSNTIDALMIMRPNFVSVSITTDSVSYIYVDNEKKGVGNWSGRLSEGSHRLEARKASHKAAIKNVQLILGKDETIVIPNPVPIYGTLDVVSDPIGANIIIDGKNFGTTPRVLTNVLIGKHELRLEKSGCASVVKAITLDDKNKLNINEQLPTGREISISTGGSGDKIFVDGNYIGDTPLTATLSFGEHEITAIRGYSGSVNDLNGGGFNAIKALNGVKAAAKTFNVTVDECNRAQLLFYDGNNITINVNGVTFEMIAVKSGLHFMGAHTVQQNDAKDEEEPVHRVILSNYFIGKFEVTEKLWQAVMGEKWDKTRPDDFPVTYISWEDCQKFISKINQITGCDFRLPTEAEWEYAADGGDRNGFNKYSGGNNLGEVAWYANNSGGVLHTVGQKQPNELGLYDMSGSVTEWCSDWYGLYNDTKQTNPIGPSEGTEKVCRGGSFQSSDKDCRVSARGHDVINAKNGNYGIYGFRLVLSPSSIARFRVFSVSKDKKVQFSKGNLQYNDSLKTWRFAEHQWDYIGGGNANISKPGYNGWIDLFGWGTGDNPTKYSKNKEDYSVFNDWGANIITNGDDKKWYSLTKDEWRYLLDRPGISYAKGVVNGVGGVILLPDDWSGREYNLRETNISDAPYNSNKIPSNDWINKLEPNGAIFLPAAGARNNISIDPFFGNYWTATTNDEETRYEEHFSNTFIGFTDVDYIFECWHGCSVRLVCDVEE